MSDVGPDANEPAAAGSMAARTRGFAARTGLRMAGVSESAADINAVAGALKNLQNVLREFSAGSYAFMGGFQRIMGTIAADTHAATTGLHSLTSALHGGIGGGGGGGGTPTAQGGMSGGGNWVHAATASAQAAIGAAGGGGGPPGGGGMGGGGYTPPPGGTDITASLGAGGNFFQDILMMPLRYMRDTITANRQTALNASQAMAMQSFATGRTSQSLMGQLGLFPGNILGQPGELLQMFQQLPQYGAMYGFGGANAPRAAGFMAGVQQMQMLNPGASPAALAQTLGGYSANTQAQQQAAYMTGGAFGMIKAGGGQKTLSEWAEGVLKWLQGLRGGSDRGKPFDYGTLQAQHFPGSNIDAWFAQMSVPPDMREYWWTYALGKASATGTTGGPEFKITPGPAAEGGGNLAWQRLNATSALTRNEFTLASTMTGAYANKEVANRWMNDLMGRFQQQVIPAAVSQGVLNFMQYLPDTMEQMLMAALERSGMGGALLGGLIGYPGVAGMMGGGLGALSGLLGGGGLGGMLGGLTGGLGGLLGGGGGLGGMLGGLLGGGGGIGGLLGGLSGLLGDVGDIGDYGDLGGTSTAGLHPDMRRRVNAMMAANPRIRVTSGLRDTALQRRLKNRGYSNVSGKSSAHTRGMAADLGPRSEYGWISANAGKFGLTSGIGVGEPWHVGMGDVGDISDIFGGLLGGVGNIFGGLLGGAGNILGALTSPLFGFAPGSAGGAFDVISGLMQMIQGGGGDASISGMAKMVPAFLNLLKGGITGGKTYDPAKLAFRGQELYDRLYAISKTPTLGGIIKGAITGGVGGALDTVFQPGSYGVPSASTEAPITSAGKSSAGTPSGWAADTKTWVGTSPSGRGDKYNQVASGDIMQGIRSSDATTRGAAVAKALYNAGFRGQDLQNFLRISYRESHWTSNQWVTDFDDTGGGILGINQLPWTKSHRPAPYTQADVLDPQGSAFIAHDMFLNVPPVNGPGGSPTYRPWQVNGNWQGGIPAEATALSQQALKIAGLGDVEAALLMSPTQRQFSGGAPIVFNNTFNLQGGVGGGGLDVKRTVMTMADQLESQMKKRLVRTN